MLPKIHTLLILIGCFLVNEKLCGQNHVRGNITPDTVWFNSMQKLHWNMPTNISGTVTNTSKYNPRIVVDHNQTLHIVFDGGVDHGLYYTYKKSDGDWNYPVELPTGKAAYPTLVVDKKNTLYLFWRGELTGGITRVMCSHEHFGDSVWSPPLVLSPPPRFSNFDVFTIAAAVDSNNTLHVFWDLNYNVQRNILLYTYKPENENWSDPVEIMTGRSGFQIVPEEDGNIQPYNFVGQNLFIGNDGTLHIVWQGSPARLQQNREIRYAFKQPNANWTIVGKIYHDEADTSWLPGTVFGPKIRETLSRELIVLFEQYSDASTSQVRMLRKPFSQGWSLASNVTDLPSLSQKPDFTVDKSGNVHVLWSQYIPYYNTIAYKMLSISDNRWSETTLLQNAYGYVPEIVLDTSGAAHAVWYGGGPLVSYGPWEIYYATGTPIQIPAAPTANAATSVTSSGFTANWSSSTGATGYRLDVSTSSSFSSYVSGYQDLDVGNVTSRSVTSLSANTTYYYRVRAYNIGGTSGNSSTITVTTTGPTLVEQFSSDIPIPYALYQNYPNPFNPLTTIQFSLPKETPVVLTIFNSLGMEIAVLVNEQLPPGHYRTQWSPRNNPSGVYFYQLRSSEFTETKKLLLLR